MADRQKREKKERTHHEELRDVMTGKKSALDSLEVNLIITILHMLLTSLRTYLLIHSFISSKKMIYLKKWMKKSIKI